MDRIFLISFLTISSIYLSSALICYQCNNEIIDSKFNLRGTFAECKENLTLSNSLKCTQADPVCVYLQLQGPLTGEIRRSCIDSWFDCSTYVYPIPDVEIKECYTCNTTKCNDKVFD